MICPVCNGQNEDTRATCLFCGNALNPNSPLAQGAMLGGRYEILNLLGSGGMGVVYKALDKMLEETVALKVLRPDIAEEADAARRFRSEIKLARKITHPNVCRIHDYGEDGALRYIAMEIVEGTDLKVLQTHQGSLPPQQAYDVSIQMAEGLQAIHDVGVVHRDLKTSNVMLDRTGRVRLMDFGIAKQVGGTLSGTAMGHLIGTPEYMSPEQAQGLKLDHRSDIYSMGIVIYEVFTNHVPFHGPSPIATIFQHLNEMPLLEGPRAAAIPTALVPVLKRALAKDAADRYSSALELAAALRRARDSTDMPPATVALTLSEALTKPLPPASPTHVEAPTPAPSRTPAPRPTPPPPAPRQTPARPKPPMTPRVETPVQPTARTPAPKSRRVMPFLLAASVAFVLAGAAVVKLGMYLIEQMGGSDPQSPQPTTTTLRSPEPTTTTLPPTTTTTTTSTTVTTTTTPPTTTTVFRISEPLPPNRPPITPPTKPPVVAPGILQLVVRPWAEVFIENEGKGQTPLAPLSLPPGSYGVRLQHPEYRPLQRRVTIEAGKTTRLEVDMRLDAIPLAPGKE